MCGRGGAAHEEVGGEYGTGEKEAAEAELEPIGFAGGRNDHGGLGELGGGIDGLAGSDCGSGGGSWSGLLNLGGNGFLCGFGGFGFEGNDIGGLHHVFWT